MVHGFGRAASLLMFAARNRQKALCFWWVLAIFWKFELRGLINDLYGATAATDFPTSR